MVIISIFDSASMGPNKKSWLREKFKILQKNSIQWFASFQISLVAISHHIFLSLHSLFPCQQLVPKSHFHIRSIFFSCPQPADVYCISHQHYPWTSLIRAKLFLHVLFLVFYFFLSFSQSHKIPNSQDRYQTHKIPNSHDNKFTRYQTHKIPNSQVTNGLDC